MAQIDELKIDMKQASREELRILAASIIDLKNYFRSQDCKICVRLRKTPPKKALSKLS